MSLNTLFHKVLVEADFLKGRKTKPLVNAITDRNPVTFYYSGPKENGKEGVKSGTRVRGEAVALGLSKGGNIIVRVFVQPPSVSKKGFARGNWRTFRVDRMSNIQVLSDETFDKMRPGYKEGDESASGPMVTTYVTSDWNKKPEIKEPETKPQTEPLPQPKKTEKPQLDPQGLPQPKSDEKPSELPTTSTKDYSSDVFNKLQTNIKDVNGQKMITTQDYQNAAKELYKMKEKEWIDSQRQLGKNTNPGGGTRKRFDITSNSELSNLLAKNGIIVNDEIPTNDVPSDETPNELQESIKRIKALMLF
jgi:hypothetical protein